MGIPLAIAFANLLGLALIAVADVARYPMAFLVLGGVALLAAVALPVMGKARVGRIIDAVSGQPAALLRLWCIFGMAFGLDLVQLAAGTLRQREHFPGIAQQRDGVRHRLALGGGRRCVFETDDALRRGNEFDLQFVAVDGEIDKPVGSLAHVADSAQSMEERLFDHDLVSVHRQACDLLAG